MGEGCVGDVLQAGLGAFGLYRVVGTPAAQRAERHEEILEALRGVGTSASKSASANSSIVHLHTSHAVPVDTVPFAIIEEGPEVPFSQLRLITTVPVTCSTDCSPQHPMAASAQAASSPSTVTCSADCAAQVITMPSPRPATTTPTLLWTSPLQRITKFRCHGRVVRPIPWPSFWVGQFTRTEDRPRLWPSFISHGCERQKQCHGVQLQTAVRDAPNGLKETHVYDVCAEEQQLYCPWSHSAENFLRRNQFIAYDPVTAAADCLTASMSQNGEVTGVLGTVYREEQFSDPSAILNMLENFLKKPCAEWEEAIANGLISSTANLFKLWHIPWFSFLFLDLTSESPSEFQHWSSYRLQHWNSCNGLTLFQCEIAWQLDAKCFYYFQRHVAWALSISVSSLSYILADWHLHNQSTLTHPAAVCITELEGTIGGMETMPFIEAVHKLSFSLVVKALMHSTVPCSLKIPIQWFASSDFQDEAATSAPVAHATMQLSVMEVYRHQLGLGVAYTQEFNTDTPDRVVLYTSPTMFGFSWGKFDCSIHSMTSRCALHVTNSELLMFTVTFGGRQGTFQGGRHSSVLDRHKGLQLPWDLGGTVAACPQAEL